jgi:predicted XRE-type DNA-binding protein
VSVPQALAALSVLFALACATLQPQSGPQDGIETAGQVKQQVSAFLTHYIQTLERKDEQAVRALFVSDDRLAWFTDGKRSYSSADEVLAGMQRYDSMRFETTLADVRVLPLGANLASADSTFVTRLTIPGSAGRTFGGVITWLVEKDPASGDWKVLRGHTSTPGGPPGRDEPERR